MNEGRKKGGKEGGRKFKNLEIIHQSDSFKVLKE